MKKTTSGFTIVELLIVIVIIAILAAITVVAYNGIQQRANDTRMRTGAGQMVKAVKLWHIKTGQTPMGGYGSATTIANGGKNCTDGGTSNGWVSSGRYACTLEDILVETNHLPENFVSRLPSNDRYSGVNDGRYSMMIYPCSGGQFALYWSLQLPSAEDAEQFDAVVDSGCPAGPYDNQGMRGAKVLTF